MKISLKKLMAGATAVAIVTMNMASMTVNAANANPTFTYADGVDVLPNTADDVVTVTLPAGLTSTNGDNLSVVITNSTGTPVDLTGLIGNAVNAGLDTTNQVTGGIILTAVVDQTQVVTFDFTPGVAGNYGISVRNTDGSIGSAVTYVGNANVVSVTASVVPTLSMNLANTTVAFGTLIPGTINTAGDTPVATVSTNATNGYILQVASANSGLLSGTDLITSASEDLSVGGADGYGIQAVGVGGTIAAPFTATGTNVGAVGGAANLMTKATPASGDTATITLKALANATTPAGNYADTLTFTISGSF
ncbi:MAG: hypothetical protein Q8K26_04680 [Candidatus Gracilibacteria bacterium]|nr:hypothetical protein [Candidatus Gracilibacteria bacterium]